jgi:alkanesulfonate monooxygenase SsuD/methylene tetrahydromethanopterin reductase-like flavin-dependent oxidoreductase (luciferase family)
MARVLEAARFDGCFFADTLGLPDIYPDIYNRSFDTYPRHGGQLSYLDPMTVLPVMARAMRHLGIGAALSTTFHHPYHLARIVLRAVGLLAGRRAGHGQGERVFIDPEKVRYADYEGRYVRTRGPLTIPRCPQGRPALMQAGSSPRGRDFAVHSAFTTPSDRSAIECKPWQHAH